MDVFSDSQLVVSHINGRYETRDATMVKYLAKVHRLANRFLHLSITRVPRMENTQANALAKLASTRRTGIRLPRIETFTLPTIIIESIVMIEGASNWVEKILYYKGWNTPD